MKHFVRPREILTCGIPPETEQDNLKVSANVRNTIDAPLLRPMLIFEALQGMIRNFHEGSGED